MKYVMVLCLFVVFSCSAEQKEKCSSPVPQAIFDANTTSVQSHQFELKGRSANEKIELNNGTSLEIYQHGCAQIIQEFSFNIPNALIKEKQHTRQAINQLNYIAGLDMKLRPFEQWANAIEQSEAAFFEAEEVEVSPGIFIKIDRIKNEEIHKVFLRFRGL